MGRIMRASAWSGTVLVTLFFIVTALRTTDGLDELEFFSWNFVGGLLLLSSHLWILAAFLAFVLLLPLKPIADRVRPLFSLPLFLIVGFSIPALIENELLHMPTREGPSPFEVKHWTELALSIVSAGVIGAGSALAAWHSIRKSGPAHASPNTSLERTPEG
jgi:hypothetical protein